MRSIHLAVILGFLLLLPSLGASAEAPATTAAVSKAPPLFEGLGGLTRKVTTSSPEAQRYFDQGPSFLYAVKHDQAISAFSQAAQHDPSCAMAFWGVAYANGPHINNPVVPPDRAAAAWKATGQAMANAAAGTPVERALIDALVRRCADPQPDDRKPLEQAYADAMRKLWQANPKDADVGALFAESLANLRPWDLWTAEGKPQPGTDELVATLDAVIALAPKHPLANHLMIHAVEASPHPEKADAAADALRDLQPGLGHMVHMPSHIDVRRGRWSQSMVANDKAIEADRRYTAISTEQGFYRLYMSHNHHMLTYGAMMTGQSAAAMKSIRTMIADIPLEFFKENAWADGFMAMPLETMMRFGKWNELLAEPAFPDFVPISRALQHYARAVAYAAKDDLASARKEQLAFLEARAKVPADAVFGNNTGADILGVAESVMDGEILYRSGKIDEGIAKLREGVKREDALRYNEPPDWIQPVRHPLGAALLQAGRFAEAETVFREDLTKLPENGWGLYGLGRALRLQKKNEEAAKVEARFKAIWKDADVKLKSACLCLPGV